MSLTWIPQIDQMRCTGCGECIASCPISALDWQDSKAGLLCPELCTYCATCETICPVGAIELPYIVKIRSEVRTYQRSYKE